MAIIHWQRLMLYSIWRGKQFVCSVANWVFPKQFCRGSDSSECNYYTIILPEDFQVWYKPFQEGLPFILMVFLSQGAVHYIVFSGGHPGETRNTDHTIPLCCLNLAESHVFRPYKASIAIAVLTCQTLEKPTAETLSWSFALGWNMFCNATIDRASKKRKECRHLQCASAFRWWHQRPEWGCSDGRICWNSHHKEGARIVRTGNPSPKLHTNQFTDKSKISVWLFGHLW